jgi:hypothetical protein
MTSGREPPAVIPGEARLGTVIPANAGIPAPVW